MSGCYDTTIQGESCHVCPAIPGVAGVPERTDINRLLGWNAGAHSSYALAGPCYVQFTAERAVGMIVGLAPTFRSYAPQHAGQGFFIYEDSGRYRWVIVENGIKVGSSAVISGATVFRVERDGGYLRYFVGNQLIRSAAVAPRAPLRVIACLYASGDTV